MKTTTKKRVKQQMCYVCRDFQNDGGGFIQAIYATVELAQSAWVMSCAKKGKPEFSLIQGSPSDYDVILKGTAIGSIEAFLVRTEVDHL